MFLETEHFKLQTYQIFFANTNNYLCIVSKVNDITKAVYLNVLILLLFGNKPGISNYE